MGCHDSWSFIHLFKCKRLYGKRESWLNNLKTRFSKQPLNYSEQPKQALEKQTKAVLNQYQENIEPRTWNAENQNDFLCGFQVKKKLPKK